MRREDKLSKLVAVFDNFHHNLSTMDSKLTSQLCENWQKVRSRYAEPTGEFSRSALAGGMEQALREIPMLLADIPSTVRRNAVIGLQSAIANHYPEFELEDKARLAKVLNRGSIRSEREFYLIRHQIDLIEGLIERESEYQRLCVLIDKFETRQKL